MNGEKNHIIKLINWKEVSRIVTGDGQLIRPKDNRPKHREVIEKMTAKAQEIHDLANKLKY
jgi:hypothetical protein